MSGALKVTLIQPDGVVRVLDNIKPGRSLMEVARESGVVGILGDCGGTCACGTCHVYVDDEWVDAVGAPDDIEAALLDMVIDAKAGSSRLSCQITLRSELDGLKVTVGPNT
jgi:2Fe-2S ferredoxin